MPRTLFDLSALKSGGGCQLALNFVTEIAQRQKLDKSQLVFLLPDVGPLSNLNQQFNGLNFLTSPTKSPIKRLVFEKATLPGIYKKWEISLVYTFFGTGLPHPKNIKSIVTVAYPIICYDESVFWKYLPNAVRKKVKLKNSFRIKRLKKADEILVETPIMLKRVSAILNKNESFFHLLQPAPSEFVSESSRTYKLKSKGIKFLFLSGTAPHKNLWRLPELAASLNGLIPDFEFIISVQEDGFLSSLKTESDRELYLANKEVFKFVGTIYPGDINNYYQNADFLCSLSDLESFSNNYMEAWKAGVPLIVSDRDFAREICQDSACYVEPHDPKSAAQKIADFLKNEDRINSGIAKGKQLIKRLPNTTQRTDNIFKYCGI